MEKKIGKHWFSWGRIHKGFALGFSISSWNWNIDLGFWYFGGEF